MAKTKRLIVSGQGARWEIPYRRRWYPGGYAGHLQWRQMWRDYYRDFIPPVMPGGVV